MRIAGQAGVEGMSTLRSQNCTRIQLLCGMWGANEGQVEGVSGVQTHADERQESTNV